MTFIRIFAAAVLIGGCVFAQAPNDPFPTPINATDGVIKVNFVEFATLPDLGGPMPARPMVLVDEPGTRRLFTNDMRGPLYTIPRQGKTVAVYLDINDPKWGVNVNATGNERGFQSFAFHPQFARQGLPGFGKFYTYTDTANTAATRSTSGRISARRSARCCASIRLAKTARTESTASRKTIRTSTTTIRIRSEKFTPSACAIRSASHGIRATATCSSRTSVRTSSKK